MFLNFDYIEFLFFLVMFFRSRNVFFSIGNWFFVCYLVLLKRIFLDILFLGEVLLYFCFVVVEVFRVDELNYKYLGNF